MKKTTPNHTINKLLKSNDTKENLKSSHNMLGIEEQI